MSHYAVIHSDRSLDYFPKNKAYDFRTYFQSPLNLTGNWYVALVDINLQAAGSKTKQNLYVHSDIAGDSFVDLLRMVRAQKVYNWFQSFETSFYVPVKKSEIRDIEIYIKTGKGDLASFLKGRATVTLHFKQYPFLA